MTEERKILSQEVVQLLNLEENFEKKLEQKSIELLREQEEWKKAESLIADQTKELEQNKKELQDLKMSKEAETKFTSNETWLKNIYKDLFEHLIEEESYRVKNLREIGKGLINFFGRSYHGETNSSGEPHGWGIQVCKNAQEELFIEFCRFNHGIREGEGLIIFENG